MIYDDLPKNVQEAIDPPCQRTVLEDFLTRTEQFHDLFEYYNRYNDFYTTWRISKTDYKILLKDYAAKKYKLSKPIRVFNRVFTNFSFSKKGKSTFFKPLKIYLYNSYDR